MGLLFVVNWAFRSSETTSETFDQPVRQLVVETNGHVSVTAGDRAEVQLHREWSLMARPTTSVEVTDGVLTATGKCGAWLFIRCQTDIDVTVPADVEVVVSTSSGAVSATGMMGGVDLQTSAGAIDVADIRGGARLQSSAGAIRGTVSDGDVEARTSAGAVTLTIDGAFDRLTAISSAGSVDLTVTDDVYRVDFDTSAGQVELDVRTDPESPRIISARSSAGNISIRRIQP